jgi:hypothetical protein
MEMSIGRDATRLRVRQRRHSRRDAARTPSSAERSASLLSKAVVYLGFRTRLAARLIDVAMCRHQVSARFLCNL